MHKFHLPFLLLLLTFSFACDRESVNLEGRWKVVQLSPPKGNEGQTDSISHLLPHVAVGNKLDFTGGELTVNRKGTADDVYYGLGSYEVAKDGKTVLMDAGNYKPLLFKLRHAEYDQVELLYKRQDVKVLLKPFEEEDEE